MPAVSKAQARFLGAVASGRARQRHAGLSASEAREFLRGSHVKSLPERKRPAKTALSSR